MPDTNRFKSHVFVEYYILKPGRYNNLYQPIKQNIVGPLKCITKEDTYTIYDQIRRAVNQFPQGTITVNIYESPSRTERIDFHDLKEFRHFLFNILPNTYGSTLAHIYPKYRCK